MYISSVCKSFTIVKKKTPIVASTAREDTEYGQCNYSGGFKLVIVKADCHTICFFNSLPNFWLYGMPFFMLIVGREGLVYKDAAILRLQLFMVQIQ